MYNSPKLIVSHAPFWHDGDSLFQLNLNIILALIPAAVFGILKYGAPALGVIALAVSSAMAWELVFNLASKQKPSIGNMEAAVIGMLYGMMLPATAPWWLVLTGTFVAIVIGKVIFGGIGGNPFNPALVGMSVLMLSWPAFFDFDTAYVSYEFTHATIAPLTAIKFHGVSIADQFPISDLFMGREVGGIGATFGLGLVIGGIYLILRGYIRWEIVVSFIAGILVTGSIFFLAKPEAYASPLFHLCSGYTLLGAFFLATENSSSPVHFIPMMIYGFLGGLMVILIRNIGAYPDGTILAILLINLINPLLDTIKPKALGKGVTHA